jgi:epimerase transport system membrane fusion protein
MTSTQAPSLALTLQQASSEASAHRELHRQVRRALFPLIAAAALAGAWSSVAPLSGAVVAPGEVKVELNRKTVQHAEGGIVR